MTKLNKLSDQERVDKLRESIRSTILECFTKDSIVRSCVFQERVINGGISDKLLYSKTVNPNHIRVWGWFEDLIECRDSSFGISALKHSEIQSYFNLMWITANPSEVNVLRLIDKIFIEIINSNKK